MTESLVDALRGQEASWNARPLVRALYTGWFQQVCAALSPVDGRSIELGTGIGTLQATCPRVEPTDVEPTPWVSEVVDAEALPYADGALANLVLVDVFHHLARPARFLDEAARTLAAGGRVVVLDPYCSAVSTPAFKRFHHEWTDLSADAFEDDASIAAEPLASNQARAPSPFFGSGQMTRAGRARSRRTTTPRVGLPLSAAPRDVRSSHRVGRGLAGVERVLGFSPRSSRSAASSCSSARRSAECASPRPGISRKRKTSSVGAAGRDASG